MRKIILRFGLPGLICLTVSCKTYKGKCCDSSGTYKITNDSAQQIFAIDSQTIDISNVEKAFIANRPDPRFGLHFFRKDSILYFTYIGMSRESVSLINLFDPRHSLNINLNGLLQKGNNYCFNIKNDTFHFFNGQTHRYTQLKLASDSSLVKIADVDLNNFFDFKNLYINGDLNIDKRIEYIPPYLLLPFGTFRTKNNADTKALLAINLKEQSGKKIFQTPDKYKNCYVFPPSPLVNLQSEESGSILAVFQKEDQIYRFNLTNPSSMEMSSGSTFQNKFMSFDIKNVENLAYTSKISLDDEENLNIIENGNYIFLIKKLFKESKQDRMRCAILIFDQHLKFITTYYPDRNVIPRMSVGYKNGVLIFGDLLTQAYYYGFQKK